MNKGKTEKIKKSYSDRVFDIVNIIIMLALLVDVYKRQVRTGGRGSGSGSGNP